MKLFMNKNEKYEEPEVHMFFHKQTKEVEQVEKFVRSLSICVNTLLKFLPLLFLLVAQKIKFPFERVCPAPFPPIEEMYDKLVRGIQS